MPLSKHFAKRHARKRAQGEQNKLYIIQRQTNTRSKAFRRSPGLLFGETAVFIIVSEKNTVDCGKMVTKIVGGERGRHIRIVSLSAYECVISDTC